MTAAATLVSTAMPELEAERLSSAAHERK